MARPRSACASAGASLTPSPTIATTRPSACSRRMTSALLRGQDVGDDLVDADLGRDGRGASPALSPVSSTGRRPSALSSATAAALVGLARVGHDAGGRAPRRPSRPRPRSGRRPAPRRARPASSPAGEPARRAALGRPATTARPSTTPSTPRPSRFAERLDRGQRRRISLARRRGDGARDRVLGGVLERARRAAAARARSTPSAATTSRSRIRPVVTRAGLVEHDRVDAAGRLEHLGPLDQDAELRAAARADEQRRRRREAERARAGDDQHGDRGRDRERRRSHRRRARTPSVRERERDRRRARRPPRRGRRAAAPGALPVCASLTSRPIWASAVSAPTCVARTTRRPPAFTVAPDDLVARRASRPASTRRSGATGRRRRSPPRRRRRWRSSRPAARRSGRRPAARRSGTRRSPPLGIQHGDVLGAELEQRRERGARAPLGARLEVAAGEDERRHDRRDLEVDRVCSRRPGTSRARTPCACPPRPAPRKQSAATDQPQAASVPTRDRACPSSPRRGAGCARRRGGTAGRPRARPASRARARPTASSRTAARGSSRAPAPAADASAASAAAGAARGRDRRPRVPAGKRARGSRRPRPRPTSSPGPTRVGVEADARPLGGVVDGRLDAVERRSGCARRGPRSAAQVMPSIGRSSARGLTVGALMRHPHRTLPP